MRSFSLSGGRPTATAQVSYDDASGIYVNAAATFVLTRDEDLRFLGVQGNIGIAGRLGDDWSVDGGIVHTEFRGAYAGAPSYDYTELYAGVTRNPVAVRVYFSPNYFRSDVRTIYGEVEGSLTPAANLRLTGHLGGLKYISTPRYIRLRHSTFYDWRLGAIRQFGNFEMHAALSGGGPGRQYYRGRSHSRTVLTVGGSWNY